MREIAQAMLDLLDRRESGALATLVRASGSTPQRVGARLLLLEDGTLVGTVGGGAVERAVIGALEECMKDRKTVTFTWDLVRDLAMCCGGRMELLVEPIEGRDRLVIFGAGHVAMPTAKLAQVAGFDVTVVDDREELNTGKRFPECERLVVEPSEAMGDLGLTQRDWVVIVTHDHRLDEEALDHCLRKPHRYIGMIGSKRKVLRVLGRIQARRSLPSLESVYAPVGLDLGAVTPEEIGMSIVAELVALRRGRPAAHLRIVDHAAIGKGASAEVADSSSDS